MAAQDAALQFLIRSVRAKNDAVKDRLENLFRAISTDDSAAKRSSAEQLAKAIEDLFALLTDSDRPTWLATLMARASRYATKKDAEGYGLLQTIVFVRPRLAEHKWPFESGSLEIDFDSIYTHFYNESRVPELFETLIDQVAEIISSGLVDSSKVLHELEILIATVKFNKSKSFSSMLWTVGFAKKFFKNVAFESLKKVPGLDVLIAAAERTVEELKAEAVGIDPRMLNEVESRATFDVPLSVEAKTTLSLPAPKEDAKEEP